MNNIKIFKSELIQAQLNSDTYKNRNVAEELSRQTEMIIIWKVKSQNTS